MVHFNTFLVLQLSFITLSGMNKCRFKNTWNQSLKVAPGLDDYHKMKQKLSLNLINLCNNHHPQKQTCFPIRYASLKIRQCSHLSFYFWIVLPIIVISKSTALVLGSWICLHCLNMKCKFSCWNTQILPFFCDFSPDF